MGILFLIIFFLVSFLIVGLVLLQEGKGGGLTGMSSGMDGVMGAKNPLRRLTAYLFVFFVLLAITINWYFHQRPETALPTGAMVPANVAANAVQEADQAAASAVQAAIDEAAKAANGSAPQAAQAVESASPEAAKPAEAPVAESTSAPESAPAAAPAN